MNGVEVLILHGSPGAGKSTMAQVASELLREADVAHAVIDVDQIALVYPTPGADFSLNNLRAIWPNYAAIPKLKVMIPTVIDDERELALLKEALPASRFMVCELTADRSVLEERVMKREPNHFWQQRLMAFVDLYHRRTDLQRIRSFLVSTDSNSEAEAAQEVMTKAGWLGPSRPVRQERIS